MVLGDKEPSFVIKMPPVIMCLTVCGHGSPGLDPLVFLDESNAFASLNLKAYFIQKK